MVSWVAQQWIPQDGYGISKRARLGGEYLAYVPDLLADRAFSIPATLSTEIGRVETKLRELSGIDSAKFQGSGLEGISRFLLRSEAISSSRIEGIAPQPDKVAIAEILQKNGLNSSQNVAQLVANNVSVLQELSQQLRNATELTLGDICAAQYLLLGDKFEPGLRTQQNWIGGDDYSPLEADFVPPPPEYVPELMADLISYLNGATHGGLIQAAIVHAQFETIHPFPDGNGRIGRALIHAVLQRRGLTRSPILPVSLVLGTQSTQYIEGLSAFRESEAGVVAWIEIFISAVAEAINQAQKLVLELANIRETWLLKIEEFRKEQGKTRALRADSIEARIVDNLPDNPLLTAAVAANIFGTSTVSSARALENLALAKVLRKKSIGRGTTGFLADDVFELISMAERRLASTKFDTAVSPPSARAVPEFPRKNT